MRDNKRHYNGTFSQNRWSTTWNERGYVTNQDIREILKVQRFTATRIAKRLIDLGLLELNGKGRGAQYLKKGTNK